jgi:hypothetical protein
VYAYLLGQEKRELQKGPDATWELLLHIRHLKDRMIRELIVRSLKPLHLRRLKANALVCRV